MTYHPLFEQDQNKVLLAMSARKVILAVGTGGGS